VAGDPRGRLVRQTRILKTRTGSSTKKDVIPFLYSAFVISATFCKNPFASFRGAWFHRTSIREEAVQAGMNDVQFSVSDFCFNLRDLCDLL
jgi:hypothetical protein